MLVAIVQLNPFLGSLELNSEGPARDNFFMSNDAVCVAGMDKSHYAVCSGLGPRMYGSAAVDHEV